MELGQGGLLRRASEAALQRSASTEACRNSEGWGTSCQGWSQGPTQGGWVKGRQSVRSVSFQVVTGSLALPEPGASSLPPVQAPELCDTGLAWLMEVTSLTLTGDPPAAQSCLHLGAHPLF